MTDGNFNSLTVTGTSDLGGDVRVGGNLAVGDVGAGLIRTLSVTGEIRGTDTLSISGALSGGSLSITGASTLQGATHLQSTLQVDGASTFAGNVGITGILSVNGRDVSADGARLDQHLAISNGNPHGTTAAQVGAVPVTGGTISGHLQVNGNIGVIGAVDGRDVSADGTRLDGHISTRGNPHGTTAAQVGALPVAGGTISGHLQVNGTATVNRTVAGVGVWSEVSGGGQKWAGFFRASSAGNDETQGVRVHAGGDGNGNKFGVIGRAEGGANADWKIGVWGQVAGGARNPYAGFFEGNVRVTGSLSKGAGSFEIDHVEDPKHKILRHNFVESPENLCLYRGKLRLGADGKGTVQMPGYFAGLTKEDEATVYLTAMGEQAFPTSYTWDETYTAFTISGTPEAEVAYLVLADRDDPVIHLLARPVEEEKGDGEKGKLFCPEAYGYSEEMRVVIQAEPFQPAPFPEAPLPPELRAPEIPQVTKPEGLDS